MTTQSDFGCYINSEQAVEAGLFEMYAQGLPYWQALRNVMLNPGNPKALENLNAAQADFERAMAQTREQALGGLFEAAGDMPGRAQRTVAALRRWVILCQSCCVGAAFG